MEGPAIPFAQTTHSNPPDMLLPRGRLGTCGCPMTKGGFFFSFLFFLFVLFLRSVMSHPGEPELSPLITGGLGCTDGLTGCVRPEALPGLIKSSAGELLASCLSQHKRSPSSCISGTRLIYARNSSAAGPGSRPASTANRRSHPSLRPNGLWAVAPKAEKICIKIFIECVELGCLLLSPLVRMRPLDSTTPMSQEERNESPCWLRAAYGSSEVAWIPEWHLNSEVFAAHSSRNSLGQAEIFISHPWTEFKVDPAIFKYLSRLCVRRNSNDGQDLFPDC